MNANELVGELVADHKAEIIEKAASKLAARLAKVCLPDAEKLFRQRMEVAADEMVAEQLASIEVATFCDTDSWGNSRGGPDLTLLEVLASKAREWLGKEVDSRGESYGSTDRTRGQWMIEQAAAQLVKGELAPAISQAKVALKKEIENRLSKVFLKAIREA